MGGRPHSHWANSSDAELVVHFQPVQQSASRVQDPYLSLHEHVPLPPQCVVAHSLSDVHGVFVARLQRPGKPFRPVHSRDWPALQSLSVRQVSRNALALQAPLTQLPLQQSSAPAQRLPGRTQHV